jgi:hypothetical protein
MFQTGHFFGLISAFNPSLAQTISVTKNGTSAFFGESVSSLVDISTRHKTIEETINSISTNLISADFYSRIKLSDKANFTISGRRSLTDFFASPTYGNYKEKVFQNTVITNLSSNQTVDFNTNETFYFYDLTAQYQQKIGSKSELSVDAIMMRNILRLNQSTAAATKQSDLGQKSLGTTVNWVTNWNSKNSTQFQAYISGYSLISKNEAIESNQILNQENKVLDIGLHFKNSHRLSKSITFNNGYQYDETAVTNFDEINSPAFSRTVKEVMRTHALIMEGVFESENKKTFIKAGIRANYFEKFKSTLLEPRIQFNQALSSKIRLEILGEQKSQTLSQLIDLQQDLLGIENRRWTLANNSTIPVQKSSQLSVGLNYKDKYWLLILDNFYKKVSGITTSSQGFQNQFELTRSGGSYTVMGTEVFIQRNFGRFYCWLSYSHNDNKYDFNSLAPVYFINNFELKHSLAATGNYEWKTIKFSLGAKWHTGKPTTTPRTTTLDTSNQIVYNAPNNSRLNDFFQVNFSASKKWKLSGKKSIEANISVINIFNTKNSINRFYRVNTTNNSIEELNNYSLDFTPNGNLKFNF